MYPDHNDREMRRAMVLNSKQALQDEISKYANAVEAITKQIARLDKELEVLRLLDELDETSLRARRRTK